MNSTSRPMKCANFGVRWTCHRFGFFGEAFCSARQNGKLRKTIESGDKSPHSKVHNTPGSASGGALRATTVWVYFSARFSSYSNCVASVKRSSGRFASRRITMPSNKAGIAR